ncbi:MAG: hypothetical protein ROM03_05205 [Mucispirillum sp.]|nr:hypothetical protein [Mucispirillum sp.]
MKKITVLLTALACAFSFANVSFAQEQNTSDTAVTAKKRPAPIPRAHIVEDYLPILGKQARANGVRPPKPFFISAIYYHMEIPQTITNAVGYDFQSATPIPINSMPVRMENAKIVTNSGGLRAGFNLFPFMSIFGVYMHTEGYSEFTAVADGNAAMPNGYMLNQKIDFKADTGAVGVGFQYGMRIGRVVPFAVLNANYAWTTTNMTDQIIETLIAGARVGLRVPLPKNMGISAHIGTQYQYLPMGNQRSGQYTVTLPPNTIVGISDPLTVTSRYRANAQNASPWAMNAGIAFSATEHFMMLLEFGFLSRFTTMLAVQANF